MTARAENEAYVKSQLRERFRKAKQAAVIVGESTKYLRKFVAWEIDIAKQGDLPIIVVNSKPGSEALTTISVRHRFGTIVQCMLILK
jgi:MTH538 TIR-like domain (DUF1863)